MDICGRLQSHIEKLRQIKQEISTNLSDLINRLNQMAMISLQWITEYEAKYLSFIDICKSGKSNLKENEILNKLESAEFPRISSTNVLTENPFRPINLFDIEHPELKICEIHQIHDPYHCRCGKVHCQYCLLDFLNSGIDLCPCGLILSPRDKFAIDPSRRKSRNPIN